MNGLRQAATDLPGIEEIIPFSVPLAARFRGVTERHGLLLRGSQGWGEWSPFDEYDDSTAAVWLDAAIDAACSCPPPVQREMIPINVTIPSVHPDAARALVVASECTTAKVKVAESGYSLADDAARVAAVRSEIGPAGHIRVDANAGWTLEEAVIALGVLEEAAGGLEYVEQPCARLEALAEVRARTGVRVAADEAIRRDHADPELVRDAVDVVVIKVQPSGGIPAALLLVERLRLPAVVSSALETSVGLAAGARLAAALPELHYACGLGTGLLLANDVVSSPPRPHGGFLEARQMFEAAAADSDALRKPVPSPPAMVVKSLYARLSRAVAARGDWGR